MIQNSRIKIFSSSPISQFEYLPLSTAKVKFKSEVMSQNNFQSNSKLQLQVQVQVQVQVHVQVQVQVQVQF